MPYKESPFDRIIEVGWKAPIGILEINTVPMSNYSFEAPYSSQWFLNGYSAGDPVPDADYEAADVPVVRVPIAGEGSLETLYDVTHTYWAIEAFIAAPGTAPAKPPNAIDLYNDYVANDWSPLVNLYSGSGDGFRWQTVLDLRTLPNPLVYQDGALQGGEEGGVFPGVLAYTNPWADNNYGSTTGHFHWLNYPNTDESEPDPDQPGYHRFVQWDQWLSPEQVEWGLGEHRVTERVLVERERLSYLILFKFLPIDQAITISNSVGIADVEEFPGYTTVFTLRVYAGGTFKIGDDGRIANEGSTLLSDSTKSISYRTEGSALVAITRYGLS